MGLELWGGVECSRVHVHDRTVDQLELTGHASRRSDMQLLAGLGLDAVRYPLLMERVAPNGPASADWGWPDERLALLREAGIRPVATLVHLSTRYGELDVRHDGFAEAVAGYAAAVAARYPWLSDYTPINEPMTSARFACLYGFWFPHERDDEQFYRTAVILSRAVALSMQAVRRVNPGARLVYTGDLGWSHGTPLLAEQAAFENERRWLCLDLLCGRVDQAHPLHARLLAAGVGARDLDWFLEQPCPPDVLGCNYYPTSERVLDERMHLYPAWSHGGNGRLAYADVHVGLAPESAPLGLERLLRLAWSRYGLPLALTEVHVDAPAEGQVRWLEEAWCLANRLAADGVAVTAVCSWALFGSYDWNSLMTRRDEHYEPGAFDLRSGAPAPTLLAATLKRLGARPAVGGR